MENKDIIKFLKDNNFIPSKKLGQNFLLSKEYKQKIVDVANVNPEDFVLEIGPGFGAITDFIINKTKNVTLIEFDKRLYEFLCNQFKDINIINADILKTDLNKIFKNVKQKKSIVISNLPYSISSQVIISLLKVKSIDYMVLMVQKEMATRITSKVGSKKYNGFSILISLLADVKNEFDVPSTVFYPEPHVISTVIKITPKKEINFDIEKVEKFLRICFSNKRKKLVNNLKSNFNKITICESFKKLNLDENIRPEELDGNQYLILMRELKYGN